MAVEGGGDTKFSVRKKVMIFMVIGRTKRAGKWLAVAALVGLAMIVGPVEAAAQQEGDETSAVEEPEVDDESLMAAPQPEEESANYPALKEAIEAAIGGELERAEVSIHVEDLERDEVLYSREADRLMNPASNVKLVTAAVVLDQLGPNHTFTTELSTTSNSDGRIDDLYVRGEGEAFLLYRDVLEWAGRLRHRGVEQIAGDLIIDDGAFDGAYLPPGFDMRDAGAAYRSPIGAVSVNFNAVAARVEPGDRIGESPNVELDPPNDHVVVENRARTVYGPYPHIDVSAEATDDGTTLTIDGTIGINADAIVQRMRIDDPPAFAGSVVAGAMELVGIDFDGEIRSGTTPDDVEQLWSHESQPVVDAINAMNKWSNNFIAEQLLRVLGGLDDAPSTWEASRNRAARVLAGYGFDHGSYRLHNGSGLYDGNELSARQIVGLLRGMQAHRWGPEFSSSLAIAGVDGTLRHRLDGDATRGNLRAKTGTLRDVTALSGYVETASGRPVAFSILINDPPRRAWRYRDDQDAIARAIAEFDG